MKALLLALPILLLAISCGGPGASRDGTPSGHPATDRTGEEEPSTGNLDDFISATMKEHGIPGLAALVISNNQVVLAKGYGMADIASGKSVTPDTDFLISSCSKPIGAVSLMELYDQGKFGLDDDIDNYLPITARNPNFPRTPITVRELLTHTSSLARDLPDSLESITPSDPTVTLAQLFGTYFRRGGAYYSDKNFLDSAPGAEYQYSNEGASLWAYLAEVISGQPFYQYSQQALISKLGMTNTSWRLADIDRSSLATQYVVDDNGRLKPVAAFSYIDYPSGSVRTSVRQLAKFLLMFMNNGTYNGVRILNAKTVAEMERRQIPELEETQGLAWFYARIGGDQVIAHDGMDDGSGCYMFFRPKDNAGVILLMNVRPDDTDEDVIGQRLLEFATNGR